MPHRRAARFLWHNLAVVALLLAALSSSLSLYLNGERLDDINRDRVVSCVRTYEGVREVFKPFFRAKSQRTRREQRNVDRFNERVDELKARCGQQTGVRRQP